ncbi:PilN domain-containing protein [Thermodesulfobacteriota bacterium]
MSRKILGLDIRDNFVTALLVGSGIKGIQIEAQLHLPVSDDEDKDIGLSRSLETITEKMDLTGSVCIASFPANQTSYRNIQIPFKQEKKIRQILPFELEPMMPFAIEDLIIDFQSVKFNEPAIQTDLIAVTVEKSKLETYLEILDSFAINPEIVTIGCFSSALCLLHFADASEKLEKWVLADVEDDKCTVFNILSEKIGLVRSFSINSDPSRRIETLCADIKRTFHAVEDIFQQDFWPDKILVTGSGLYQKSIEAEMEQRLDIPVKAINLMQDLDIGGKLQPSPVLEPALYNNAIALALTEIMGIKGLNFRKGPFAPKKQWAEHKTSFIKTGMIAAVLLILALTNTIQETRTLSQKIDRLDKQIIDIFKGTFPEVNKIVDPLHQMRVKMKEAHKNSLSSTDAVKSIRAIDILNTISTLIPAKTDVDFGTLVIGKDNVLINGNTDTFNSVDDMKNRLEKANLFQKVTISSANLEKSGNRVRFKLKIQLSG